MSTVLHLYTPEFSHAHRHPSEPHYRAIEGNYLISMEALYRQVSNLLSALLSLDQLTIAPQWGYEFEAACCTILTCL